MRKYRPSNGAEGMDFMEAWCLKCIRYETDCQILKDSFWYQENNPKYPPELVCDDNCVPSCTAFNSIEQVEHNKGMGS